MSARSDTENKNTQTGVFNADFDPRKRKQYSTSQIKVFVDDYLNGEVFHMVLIHLLQGYKIDRIMAQNLYLIGDVRSRISEIKRVLGEHFINDKYKPHDKKDGKKTRIKDYWMPPERIDEFWKTIDTDLFFTPKKVRSMIRNGAPLKEPYSLVHEREGFTPTDKNNKESN